MGMTCHVCDFWGYRVAFLGWGMGVIVIFDHDLAVDLCFLGKITFLNLDLIMCDIFHEYFTRKYL